ncbi:MAG TPA: TadE/TadG family type IV pilus assembly protein [Azospirillaceae bacterium]|nr:TadE/TadG family type IV pilus assembly protein [Azospirillaceae bacterium]
MLRKLDRKGAAAIETALLFPVLLLLGAGVADFGFGVYDHMRLTSAVRAGTQTALQYPDDAAGIQAAVETALALAPGAATVTVAASCECPGGGEVDCGVGVCQTGTMRKHVTVSVTQPKQWLVDYPLIAKPDVLTAQASIRVE